MSNRLTHRLQGLVERSSFGIKEACGRPFAGVGIETLGVLVRVRSQRRSLAESSWMVFENAYFRPRKV